MKYFNVEIQIKDNVATTAIFARESKDEAVTSFHTSMASMRAAVDAGNLDEATGLVLNSYGGIETPYMEHYMKAEEPQSEPNEG